MMVPCPYLTDSLFFFSNEVTRDASFPLLRLVQIAYKKKTKKKQNWISIYLSFISLLGNRNNARRSHSRQPEMTWTNLPCYYTCVSRPPLLSSPPLPSAATPSRPLLHPYPHLYLPLSSLLPPSPLPAPPHLPCTPLTSRICSHLRDRCSSHAQPGSD